MINWKLSQDGKTASRTLSNGSFEFRLISAIPEDELATALPADSMAPQIPASITMRQARLALLQSGLLTTVNAAVAAMPGVEGDAARIEWEFSGNVERNRPLVQSLAAALGLTEAQLDELFMLAATL